MLNDKETVKAELSELWPIMEEKILSGGKVKFHPKGTSMLPLLRQGIDSVELTKAPETLKKYDIPLYKRENGQFVLHRVVKVTKNGYVMCGDNQYVREKYIQNDQILAITSGIYKGNKYIPCNDKDYIKYSKKQVLKKHIQSYLSKIKRFVIKLIKKD